MQIVIDIPEEEYNFVKKQVAVGNTNPLKICIANGTPLPKGHGILYMQKFLLRFFARLIKRYCAKQNETCNHCIFRAQYGGCLINDPDFPSEWEL